MTPLVRALQWIGLAVLVVSAFLPTLQLRAFPAQSGAPEAWHAAMFVVSSPEVPSEVLGRAVWDTFEGLGAACPFWSARRWYPWYLALLWLPALLLVRRQPAGTRRRQVLGGTLWASSVGLLLFEAAYLHAEYLPLLSGVLGRIEGVGVWLVVAAILLYRRPQDRRLGAVEATVASQALLGFAHALTLPATMARAWIGGFPPRSVAEALWINFPPAFWAGSLALLLIALPTYFRRKPSTAPPS